MKIHPLTEPLSIAGINVECGLRAQYSQIFPRSLRGLAAGRKQQLDRGGIEANPVIKGADLMALVDPSDYQHTNESLQLVDLAWIARKEGLDCEAFHDGIDPGRRNIDARKLDFVDLHDDDPIVKRRGFDNDRGVLGTGSRVDVASLSACSAQTRTTFGT